MDTSNVHEIDEQEDDNCFLDAQDDFPFDECTDSTESEIKTSPELRPGLRRRIKAGASGEGGRGNDSVPSIANTSVRVNLDLDRVDSVRVAECSSRDEGEDSTSTVAGDERIRELKESATSDREIEVFVEEKGRDGDSVERVNDSVESTARDQKIEEKAHRVDGSVADERKNEVPVMDYERVDDSTDSANSLQTRSNHRCRSFGRLAGKSTRQRSKFSATGSVDSAVKTDSHSTITTEDKDRIGDSADSVANSGNEIREPSSSSFLLTLAEFVIKAIWFQLNLLFTFISLPIWFMYTCINFIINPFSTIKRGRNYFFGKLQETWQLICKILNHFLFGWLKEHKSLWNIVLRYGWALFWAIYVGFILCGLLLSASLMGAVVMRYLVVEPIKIEEKLNFDYTKHRPVACVPVLSCGSVRCRAINKEMVGEGIKRKSRVIPENHKLEAAVSLVLPESQYNRNLGVFQIRVEFLSLTGEVLSSASHPCMLHFKSEPIQLLLTALKIAPLVTGYMSESQTINVKFQGFTESDVPTACVRVIIEQRAEFPPGAGIPEIYDASFVLESGLSFLRRVIWYWKKTVYIWISMLFFTVEMLFTLICCRPIIIPRMRRRDNSASSSTSQRNPPAVS